MRNTIVLINLFINKGYYPTHPIQYMANPKNLFKIITYYSLSYKNSLVLIFH